MGPRGMGGPDLRSWSSEAGGQPFWLKGRGEDQAGTWVGVGPPLAHPPLAKPILSPPPPVCSMLTSLSCLWLILPGPFKNCLGTGALEGAVRAPTPPFSCLPLLRPLPAADSAEALDAWVRVSPLLG